MRLLFWTFWVGTDSISHDLLVVLTSFPYKAIIVQKTLICLCFIALC